VKDTIVAGDTIDNGYVVEGFPSTDGWTLELRLIPHPNQPGTKPILLAANPVEDGSYRLQVGPSVSSDWAPGEYSLTRVVEKPGARYTLDPDPNLPKQVEIQADSATAATFDGRSGARRNLEAIEAFLGGRASNAIQEYEINGRRLVNYKPAELISLADYFRRQVANEDRAAAFANGRGNPRHLYIGFPR
jgi:hypothetical protein